MPPYTKSINTNGIEVRVYPNGSKEWWLNGKLHRTDGPAMECPDGSKFWYLDGLRHRTNGPAIEWAGGDKYWRLYDKLHRADGPAVELSNGYKAWWLNGRQYTKVEFDKIRPTIVMAANKSPQTKDWVCSCGADNECGYPCWRCGTKQG